MWENIRENLWENCLDYCGHTIHRDKGRLQKEKNLIFGLLAQTRLTPPSDFGPPEQVNLFIFEFRIYRA